MGSEKSRTEKAFRVTFFNQGKVYEIYARSVGQGELLGFVDVDGLLFGERTQVVVDPSEESLKTELEGVTRISIPMHSVIRIDEVEKQGVPRITSQTGGGTVMPFPTPIFNKPGSGES